MKKARILSFVLAVCLIASGCGSDNVSSGQDSTSSEATTTSATTAAAAEESTEETQEAVSQPAVESKVINIFTLTDMMENLTKTYYPDYIDNGDGTGYIGDVKIVWQEAFGANGDGDYSEALKYRMEQQPDLPAEERIDIVVIEPDYYYGQDFLDSEWSLPLSEVGITDADTAQMYEYTKQLGSDSSGELKALSCQASAGVFAYRRSIAKAVLGTDDPEEVQKYVADWDVFTQTAQQMKDSGYYMHISYDEAFDLAYMNSSAPLTDAENRTVAHELEEWVHRTAMYVENGYITNDAMWTSEWADAMADGSTFGCFMPTWGIEFTVPENCSDSIGDWAICEGPAPYYNGATYLAPAYMTDNPEEVGEFLRTLCCNSAVMQKFCESETGYTDMPNNMEAVAALAADDACAREFLGGQNPYAVYDAAARAVDAQNISGYDSAWTWSFISAMKPYIFGDKTYDEALAEFFDK